MSATGERAQAYETAENGDFSKALRLAENVGEAWYRCQSLAAVARYAPEGEVVRVANKAFKAAQEAGDAYKRVAVCAWPVRALAETGKTEPAAKALQNALEEARQIEHPVSKISALELLWQGAWPLPTVIKQPVLNALLSACHEANSWKAGRIMKYTALAVATEDMKQAQQIVASMRESPYKRQAQKHLDAKQTETVRDFFSRRRTAQEEAEFLEYLKKRAEEREKRRTEHAKKREQRRNIRRPNL